MGDGAEMAGEERPRRRWHESIVDAVGGFSSPLVRLRRSLPPEAAADDSVLVFAKMECLNPGGSSKDRIAKSMLGDAEKRGIIEPGRTTVVEYTSGNTGVSLAMVCAAKGYRCIIIMPQLPLPPMIERYIACRKFGAQVHLTAPATGVPGMRAHLEDLLTANKDYWSPRQFENEANPNVHFDTTGPEIWAQTGGRVDYFIAGAGTGGTIVGAGKFLKQKNPACKLILVEPSESRALVGKPHTKHSIFGIGAGCALPFIENLAPGKPYEEGPRGIIDEFCEASSSQAIDCVNLLAQKEGILVGPSTGAAFKVASDVARRPEARGKSIVVVFPSAGIRYIAHPMWDAERAEAAFALPDSACMQALPLVRFISPLPPPTPPASSSPTPALPSASTLFPFLHGSRLAGETRGGEGAAGMAAHRPEKDPMMAAHRPEKDPHFAQPRGAPGYSSYVGTAAAGAATKSPELCPWLVPAPLLQQARATPLLDEAGAAACRSARAVSETPSLTPSLVSAISRNDDDECDDTALAAGPSKKAHYHETRKFD